MKFFALFKKQYAKDVLFFLEQFSLFTALLLLTYTLEFQAANFKGLARGLLGALLYSTAFLLLFLLDKKISLTEKLSSRRYYKLLTIFIFACGSLTAFDLYQGIYYYFSFNPFKKDIPPLIFAIAAIQLSLLFFGLLLTWKGRIWRREGVIVLSLLFLTLLGVSASLSVESFLNTLSRPAITVLVFFNLFPRIFLVSLVAFILLRWAHIRWAKDWIAE
ncbi:MAG: hypothetical protein LBE75_07255 [Burkholderiales bacterium]|jgi:hypothetical protein|nr:hypothetical protein [Burkholderiales bacterium]